MPARCLAPHRGQGPRPWWQAPTGTWYLAVAGSRDVLRISVADPVAVAAESRQLVLPLTPPAPGGPLPTVTTETRQGSMIPAPR